MRVRALSLILSHLLICISLVDASVICYDTGSFTKTSTYGRNRDQILSSLPANVSAKGGFFTASIGQNSDKVYALGMCSEQATCTQCYKCIDASIYKLVANCTNQKEAISWPSVQCLVRYADHSFSGVLELEPTEVGYITGNIKSNLKEFDAVWDSLMDSVVKKASNGTSILKHATGEADFKASQKIYAEMQCTPDISHKDCDSCLRQSVSYYKSCCHGSRAAHVLKPNCIFHWYIYRSNASTTAPFLSPPQSVNSTITKEERGSSSQTVVIIVVAIVIFMAVLVILAVAVLLKRINKRKQDDRNSKIDVESLHFDFNAVRVATENFSDANMLGRGGFGPVYKGKLKDGRRVAIKRLSQNSGQGEQEFKNEVVLLAKLQHRNLIRLLGFSLQQKERILIYEFLPNSSLDKVIFDPVKRLLLNWEKRYKTIEGIAKGLLYLHEDSQYRIIHRDLKAANILLDEEMKPKISDFGMAKLFAVDQSRADTSKIVGTFGYMAPEYAWHGQYSVKSDVYAFGVLVLEIISGQKISSFSNQETGDSLLNHAWRSWNEGTAMEVVDPILRDGPRSEIIRCIHLGLLCVQENIAYRPTIAYVVLMLTGYSGSLPVPSRPAYFMHSDNEAPVNEASISELDPR